MKLKYLIVLLLGFSFFGCETYSDIEVEYSDTYPLSGDYYVMDYDENDEAGTPYILKIYNTAIDGAEKVWVDGVQNAKWKVRAAADVEGKSFSANLLPHEDDVDASFFVTITNASVMLKDWPTPDSIYFEVAVFDAEGVDKGVFYTTGHRRTGFEPGQEYYTYP